MLEREMLCGLGVFLQIGLVVSLLIVVGIGKIIRLENAKNRIRRQSGEV